jgi:hypothetical protein
MRTRDKLCIATWPVTISDGSIVQRQSELLLNGPVHDNASGSTHTTPVIESRVAFDCDQPAAGYIRRHDGLQRSQPGMFLLRINERKDRELHSPLRYLNVSSV